MSSQNDRKITREEFDKSQEELNSLKLEVGKLHEMLKKQGPSTLTSKTNASDNNDEYEELSKTLPPSNVMIYKSMSPMGIYGLIAFIISLIFYLS